MGAPALSVNARDEGGSTGAPGPFGCKAVFSTCEAEDSIGVSGRCGSWAAAGPCGEGDEDRVSGPCGCRAASGTCKWKDANGVSAIDGSRGWADSSIGRLPGALGAALVRGLSSGVGSGLASTAGGIDAAEVFRCARLACAVGLGGLTGVAGAEACARATGDSIDEVVVAASGGSPASAHEACATGAAGATPRA